MKNKFNKISIFGAYDIRGKYPSEINEKIVEGIVPAILKTLKTQKSGAKIVVGHDVRLSSPALYKAVVKALKIVRRRRIHLWRKNSKLKIVLVGMITTPMLYFLVNKFKANGGIMVTASHNPEEYNGLKVVGPKAVSISGREILAKMQNVKISSRGGSSFGGKNQNDKSKC